MSWWVNRCTYRGEEQIKSQEFPAEKLSSIEKKKSQMAKILFHFPRAKENPTLCNKLVNSC